MLWTLHARGVRGFVTFNTLVFDYELREAAALAPSVRNQILPDLKRRGILTWAFQGLV